MQYSKWVGLASCVILVIACFIPWAYYPDINKNFTGFFSQDNSYGKPGKFLVFFALLSAILIMLPRVWAKRAHIFFAAVFTGYAIKTYVLFTSCYNTFCPQRKAGIYLMMISCFLILIISIFPDIKIRGKKNN